MTRVLFLIGLALLLVASTGTATLATRAAPRLGVVTALPADTFTDLQRAGGAQSLPFTAAPSGAAGFWLLAAVLATLALALAALALRRGPHPFPSRTRLLATLGAGAALAALGLWLALARPAASPPALNTDVSTPVARAEWPARVETDAPSTVSAWLTADSSLLPGRIATCASASLITTSGMASRLMTPGGCRPLGRGTLEWTWRIEAGQERLYRSEVRIDVTWALADGRAATQTIWVETLSIQADAVLIPSGPLGALSLAGAGLGMTLTVPVAYRRGRESWLEQGTIDFDPLTGQPIPRSQTEAPGPPAVTPASPDPSAQAARGGGLLRRVGGTLPRAAEAPPGPSTAAPHLNTEFTGAAARELLRVGRATPLLVWVGERIESAVGRSSRPFPFDFSGQREPLDFDVRVDGDPECWRIEAVQPRMVVRPPGSTEQAAVFRITALKPGTDKLVLTVTQTATGAAVQHVWLPVRAEQQPEAEPRAPARPALHALLKDHADMPQRAAAIRLPLDSANLKPRHVRLTIASGRDPESFTAVVDAELPGGRVHQIYSVPVSAAAVQNATLRLRQELERIVLFAADDAGAPFHPFADPYRLAVDAPLARQAAAPLADAGQQVWHLLFNAPRAPGGLRHFAAALRDLPHGSAIQVVIESQQFILPWALLYDRPGEITPDTLDWSGFWGYRYILDVLPPGDYPEPEIDMLPPDVRLLFNDDPQLRRFTEAQERFVRGELGIARAEAAWGAAAVRQALAAGASATLLYVFCHGQHESGAARPGALPSESALTFSPGDRVRLADMRRILSGPLGGRPLVFLNACEGATQDAFYYDGFMPFFIEECGARGFIGAEVKTPQLLAHDLALRFMRLFADGVPVGEALWRLRREYLDQHNNPLAFNYTLYGLDEVRLARPLSA